MPFISTKAREDATTAGSTKDNYLNPSSVKSGQKVRFTLLAEEPFMFYELWGNDVNDPQKRKPFRFSEEPTNEDIAVKLGDDFVRSLTRDGKGPEACKIAQAVPVYNYDMERVQVFSWTQKTVTQALDNISQLEDYEDSMTECDFYLSRDGEGTDTRYTVQAAPKKKAMAKTVDESWDAAQDEGFDLSRLIDGGDPFKESE
tara:strand:+ start:500 stop:1102 length:603 start_codon:yes stop_codon:yes gene_type:complete